MKNIYITTAIGCLWACFAFAQENLVPNPGFEEGLQPKCISYYSYEGTFWSIKDISKRRQQAAAFDAHVNSWRRVKTREMDGFPSPDYYDSSIAVCAETNNCPGYPYKRRYSAKYVGLGGEEGIRNNLTQPLQPGKAYYVRFLFRDSQGSRAKVLVSVYGEHWYRNNGNERFQFGQVHDIASVNCTWDYMQMKLTIPAGKTGLQNLIFASENGYFSIDDVELFEACPDTMHVQDRRYHALAFPEPEEAGRLRAGYRVTNNRTPGDVIVKEGTVIKYKGANEVSLEDGFYVNKGGDFHAYIAPCGMRCPPFNIVRDLDTVICTTMPFIITGEPSYNSTYQWTALDPAHLAYLEATNVYAPVFSPPLLGMGFIRYTLKTTNTCGEVYYRNVNIKYDMGNSSAPNFTVLDSSLTDSLAFSLALNGHTEKVRVELLSCANPAQVIQAYEYDAFEDFNGTTFNWTMPDEVDLCQCYNVRISTKNFCNPQWYSRTISWPLLPRSDFAITLHNVIGNMDGCNYCFTVKAHNPMES